MANPEENNNIHQRRARGGVAVSRLEAVDGQKTRFGGNEQCFQTVQSPSPVTGAIVVLRLLEYTMARPGCILCCRAAAHETKQLCHETIFRLSRRRGETYEAHMFHGIGAIIIMLARCDAATS